MAIKKNPTKVALTTVMLVSSPLTALQTAVSLEMQRWLCFTGFQDFKSSGHLWITPVPVVQLQQQLFYLNIKSHIKNHSLLSTFDY